MPSESHGYVQFMDRDEKLFKAFETLKNTKGFEKEFRSELLRYFPIAYIACIESYFRSAIKELIDFGEPYSNNSLKFDDIRFKIDSVFAIANKTVSVGEFIAHLLPLKNLRTINAQMSVLIGEDFLKRLNKTKLPADKHSKARTVEESTDNLFTTVEGFFDRRHIFCHEFAPIIELNEASIENEMSLGFIFVFGTQCLMRELTQKTK